MKKSFLSRSLHKWLALMLGIQLLIWLATGLYMVVVDLDFIHGDPLVKNNRQNLSLPVSGRVSITTLRRQYPGATAISLRPVMGQTLYLVSTQGKRYLIDPQDGAVVSPLDETAARKIATFHFNGDGPIHNTELLLDNPPGEIRGWPLPLWRVDFDDRFNTSFYIDPFTGALATRRHQYWRLFDFFFMLHIMDYEARENVHNLLLKFAQFAGLSFALSGLWLLFYSFKRRGEAAVK